MNRTRTGSVQSTGQYFIYVLERFYIIYFRSYVAQDAPVECARLFHVRLQRVMREWIYINGGKEKGLFGRVKDYVIRYEVQDRG